MSALEVVRVDAERVTPTIEAWIAAGNRLDVLPPRFSRACRRLLSGEQRTLELGALDRLLVALDLPHLLAEIVPHKRTGRAGYTWPNPHPLRRLTAAQVTAAHRLHIDGGLSLRELGRQLHAKLGYSSAHSCAMALSAAFKRDGLERRTRAEAVHLANEARGYVRGRSARERRRALRASLRATDPAYRAEEQARLQRLHAAGH